MGQVIRKTALVVEDDELQRDLLVTILEECDFGVIECESAEAAFLVLEEIGPTVSFLFTDVELAGTIRGDELAQTARQRFPNLRIIVTSANTRPALPDEITFIPKPWLSLEVIREAERARRG